MLRIISLSISTILFLNYELKSQQFYFFDDFDGARTLCISPNSITFPDALFPNWNWGRSHGSPSSHGSSEIFMFHKFIQTPSDFFNEGEGIFANIHFNRNTKYIVTLNVSRFSKNQNIANGKIHMKLIDDQNNAGCGTTNIHDLIPTFASQFDVLDLSTGDILSPTNITITFRTPVNQDFDAICIFPQDMHFDLEQVDLIIECISIHGCGDADEIYDNVIPNNNKLARSFQIGSSFGFSSSLAYNSNTNTTLTASNFELFKENTLITPNDRSYFLARIKRCSEGLFEDEELFKDVPRVTLEENAHCIATNKQNNERRNFAAQKSSTGFSIYPNPAKDVILISSNFSMPFNISMYSSEGKLVFQKNNLQTNTTLDINKFRNGFYYIKIIDDENNQFSQTIIKE